MDETEIGEFAYDYVELTRDVVHGVEHADLMEGKADLDAETKSEH